MDQNNENKKIMPLRYNEKTWLSGRIAETTGGFASHRGAQAYCLHFRGDGSAVWTVEAARQETFDLKLAYFAGKAAARVTLRLGSQTVCQVFPPVNGYASQQIPMRDPAMMQNPEDCESVEVVDTLTIPEGIREIHLQVETRGEFRVFYLELIPRSAKAAIEEKEAEAARLRPSIFALAQKGYGLFIHWTARTKPRYGEMLPYEEAVNAFDAERFARQAEEMGAQYVIFTTNHGSEAFPAPLTAWNKYHPGKITARDLPADLITALEKRGIQLFLYLHIPHMAGFPSDYGTSFNFTNTAMRDTAAQSEICGRICEMLEEIGLRYGEKLAGYWLDCWQPMVLKYGTDPTEQVYKAAKAGNSRRLTSFAFGVRCPTCTPWQDYACGETRVIGMLPKEGRYAGGQSKGYPYHSILVLDDDWWHDFYDNPIADPQYSADQLSDYIRGCMKNGGLVTVNTAVYQDGTVSPKTMDVMKLTKKRVYA